MKKSHIEDCRMDALRGWWFAVCLLFVVLSVPLRGQQPVPYVQDFERCYGLFPAGWAHLDSAGYVGLTTNDVHGGQYSLCLVGAVDTASVPIPVVVALPEMAVEISLLELSFWVRPSSHLHLSCGEFDVGYLPAGGADTDFVTVETYRYSDFLNDFELRGVMFSSAPAGARMALRCRSLWDTWYVDDVRVDYLPSCPPVSGLAVEARYDSTLVSWHPEGAESTWLVFVGEDQYLATDTFVMVPTNPNEDYEVSVYALCGSIRDTSRAVTRFFHTPCAPVTDTLPYMMDFEEGAACWQLYECGGGVVHDAAGTYASVAADASYGGLRSLCLRGLRTGTLNYGYAVLPRFVEALGGLQISFMMMGFDVPAIIKVGVMSDPADPATFVAVELLQGRDAWVWEPYVCSLAGVPADHPYIAIGLFPSASESLLSYTYIDSVVVEFIPDCVPPQHLEAQNVTSGDSVVLSWSGCDGGFAWQLAVGERGFDPDTLTNLLPGLTDTTYTLTGLSNGVCYDAYVRTDCGTEVSRWRGPVDFIPGYYTMRRLGSDTLRGCGFAITDNGGPNGNYSDQCISTLVVYPHGADSAVRVWGFSHTDGSTDYISIYDGVGTDGTVLWSDYGVDQWQSFGPYTSYSGPITISFISDAYYTYEGFEIHTDCQYLSSCSAPFDLGIDSVQGDSVWVSWSDTSGAYSFDLAYVAAGLLVDLDTVETQVNNITGTSYMLSGLEQGALCDIYLRAVCGNEASRWVGPVQALPGYCRPMQVTGSDTIVGCGWTITDDGGVEAGYSPNCNAILVVRPPDTTKTFLLSVRYQLESPFDWLRIYDGEGTDGTMLWTSYGTSGRQTIADIISEQGSVTIQFHSDYSVSLDGFEIGLQCVRKSRCPRPAAVEILWFTDTSALVAWEDTSGASRWLLEYAEAGYAEGDSTVVRDTLSVRTATITGLVPSREYDVTVYALCEGLDAVPGQSIGRRVRFRASCAAVSTLPYSYGFEPAGAASEGIDGCWHLASNVSAGTGYPYVCNAGASGLHSLCFYGHRPSMGTGDEYSYAVMPLFSVPVSQLEVNFRLRADLLGGSYTADLTLGVMTNPDDIATFVPIETFSATSTTAWDRCRCYLAGYGGAGRYIAFKAESRSVGYNYVLLDDVVVDYAPACGPVTDLQVEAGPSTALARWTPSVVGSYSGAVVAYRERGGSGNPSDPAWTTLTTADSYIALTGLAQASEYELRVTALCGSDMGTAVEQVFRTGSFGCRAVDTAVVNEDTVGSCASTSYSLPSMCNYNYSLSQEVFLSSELGGLSRLTGMRIKGARASDTRQWTIYLAHTTESSVASWVMPDELAEVWSGNAQYLADGWMEFRFATPFDYNGSDNLLVMISDHSGSPSNGGNSAYVDNLTDGRVSRAMGRDGTPYDAHDIAGGEAGSAYPYRVSAVFIGHGCAEQTSCSRPLVAVQDIGEHEAEVVWAPGAGDTACRVEYRAATDSTWISVGTLAATSCRLAGLVSGSTYSVRVTSLCTDSLVGSASFTTLCGTIAALPFTEDFSSWGTGVGRLPNCWSAIGSYSLYPYISAAYNDADSRGGAMRLYLMPDGTNHTHFSLPPVDAARWTVGSLQVVVDAMTPRNDYPQGFTVGVMSDPEDWSSYTAVDTILLPADTGVWHEYEIPLDSYRGSGTYITLAAWAAGRYMDCEVYLDDVALEEIPSCPRPDSLRADSVTLSSARLSWHEHGGAAHWLVEYGPVGFAPGTGTVVSAATNPFTLSGLPPSFDGDFYVRSFCSATDTSPYSRHPGTLATNQIPATLPYHCDFEDAEALSWQSCANSPVRWVADTAEAFSPSHSLYVTAGAAAIPAAANAAAYRDVDFGATDSSFVLTFEATPVGAADARLAVLLVDPSLPAAASHVASISPWGSIDSLRLLSVVALDSGWCRYAVPIDGLHGIWRLAFFWVSQQAAAARPSVVSDATASAAIVAIDDVSIDYSACPRPVDVSLVAGSVTATAATLRWHRSAEAAYRVAYRVAGAPAATMRYLDAVPADTSDTLTFTLTGLIPSTAYSVAVQKLCVADSSLFSNELFFTTNLCDSPLLTTIDGAGSPSYTVPLNSAYRYSLTEVIIDNAELAEVRDIASLSFYYDGSQPLTVKTNCTIYFQPTAKSAFANSSDMVPLDPATAVAVYQGPLNFFSSGWNDILLSTPYSFSGSDNLLVIIDDNSHAYAGAAYTFLSAPASAYKTLTYYSNSNNPSPASPASFHDGKSRYASRPFIRLISCETAVCPSPRIQSLTHNDVMAAVTWSGTGSLYEIAIKESATTAWCDPIPLSDTAYTFTDLTPATNYDLRLRQRCSSDTLQYSHWVQTSFLTHALSCSAPEPLQLLRARSGSVTFDWLPAGFENAWDIHLWSDFSDTTYSLTAHPARIIGLVPGSPYHAAIRSRCAADAGELSPGSYGDTITFSTQSCPNVTNLVASQVTASTVTLRWSSDPMAVGSVVEYGHIGFAQGTGSSCTVVADSCTIADLLPDEAYAFYVKALCDTDWSSENWASVTATTLPPAVPCLPPDAISVVTAGNNAVVAWDAAAGDLAFELEYSLSDFDSDAQPVRLAALVSPFTLSGLAFDTPYHLRLRAVCENVTNSPWSPVTTFRTQPQQSLGCDPVSDIVVTPASATSLLVQWSPGATGDTWELLLTSILGDTLQQLVTHDPSYLLESLLPAASYILQVRTRCGEQLSDCAVVAFRMASAEDILPPVLQQGCTLSPNPAAHEVLVTLPPVSGKVTVELIDITGRLLQRTTLPEGTQHVTLPLDKVPAGTYYVRLSGSTLHAVKKLLVR